MSKQLRKLKAPLTNCEVINVVYVENDSYLVSAKVLALILLKNRD